MIRVHAKETVKEVVLDLLRLLESSGAISRMSVNGDVDNVASGSFRYGAYEFKADLLNKTQKIRFRVDLDDLLCGIQIGTDRNIDELGSVTLPPVSEGSDVHVGTLHSNEGKNVWYEYTSPDDAPQETGILFEGFASYSDHGLVMAVWEQNSIIEGTNFSWFVIQRPVNPDGTPYIEDRAPVICLYGAVPDVANQNNVQYCVVREYDVFVPTPFKRADRHHPDRVAVVNCLEQVAIAPSRKACLFFPSGFNTQRYYYSLELDMFAYTSADVISMSSTVVDDRFGSQKSYLALNANRKLNQGMRVILYNGDA